MRRGMDTGCIHQKGVMRTQAFMMFVAKLFVPKTTKKGKK